MSRCGQACFDRQTIGLLDVEIARRGNVSTPLLLLAIDAFPDDEDDDDDTEGFEIIDDDED